MKQSEADTLIEGITEQLTKSLSAQAKASYITGELATGILQVNMSNIANLITPMIEEDTEVPDEAT